MPDAWLIDLDLARLVPMMICRMIISLKKVAGSRQPQDTIQTNLQDTYSRRPVDNIPLSVLKTDGFGGQ
jgi:hypothetical protein